ncbi:MAG TPA: DUF5723 family protein [Bacteroidales bacterium]|nr:DUF5723 family protein [Bacteroidales bacterium]
MLNKNFYTSCLIIIFLTIYGFNLSAQQNNTFYLMHDVPQSNLLNPAVPINCKWFLAIPVLGSTQINYSNTAFSFNEIFTTNNGSASLNIGNFVGQLKNTNLINAELHLDLISLGYKWNEYYFNFNIAEKVHVALTYPGSLLEVAWNGNSDYLGETVEFNNLRTHSVYYREYSLSASKIWDDYNIFGIRAKLLFGKAIIYSGKTTMSLYTDPYTFDLNIEGDATENISFPIVITQNSDGRINGSDMGNLDLLSFLMNGKNKGFAIDLGWIYLYNENITLSASLLDLGFIRWKSDVTNINVYGSFDYTGFGLGNNTIDEDYITNLADSAINALNQNVSNDAFYSWLPTQIYLGGMYQYKPRLGFGVVNRNVIYRNKLHSSLTLSANTTVWNKLSAVLSWSYLNNTYKNVGIGLAWHSRGLQFHAVSDNIIGFFKPLDARNLNLRFGFGFYSGVQKIKKKGLKTIINTARKAKGIAIGLETVKRIIKRKSKRLIKVISK